MRYVVKYNYLLTCLLTFIDEREEVITAKVTACVCGICLLQSTIAVTRIIENPGGYVNTFAWGIGTRLIALFW